MSRRLSRRMRRRAERATRRPSSPSTPFDINTRMHDHIRTASCSRPLPASAATGHGEDQLHALTLTVADDEIDAWARIGRDAAYGVFVCHGCGGRDEMLMWSGSPTAASLQRSLAAIHAGDEPPLRRFAARHAACLATGSESDDSPPPAQAMQQGSHWHVPAGLDDDVCHWVDATLDDAVAAVTAEGVGAIHALLRDPIGADCTGVARRVLSASLPAIAPGAPRGPAHRRWHVALQQRVAAAGCEVAAILVTTPATAHLTSGATPSTHLSDHAFAHAYGAPATLVVLATATAAWSCFALVGDVAPEDVASEHVFTEWAPLVEPSALLDGLFARLTGA